MRWEALFEELEAELAAADDLAADSELRDRLRREAATLRLVDRLRAARGSSVSVQVGGLLLRGTLMDCGGDWVLIEESQSRDALIPVPAIASIGGLGRWTAAPDADGRVGSRLDLGYALRGIARDRTAVNASLIDGSVCTGTIDRVGLDFIEIAEHPAAEARRVSAVSSVRTVPRASILVVRST